MEMTMLLKLLCLCVGGVAFFFWGNEKYKREIRTGLFTAIGVLMIFCLNQWGWLGLFAPIAALGIGTATYWLGASGSTSLQEWYTERRDLAADIFFKLDDDGVNILAWPLHKASKAALKNYFGTGYPKKRGAWVFSPDVIEGVLHQLISKPFAIATHKNMEGHMPTVPNMEEAPYPMPAVKVKKYRPVGYYKRRTTV